ncbi:MAG: lysoplasmalogenase [Rhodobacter sp.]|uniref:lysoplasmalogenase n=1 Tax=Pararhodobacter sp. TaxID=2127056 RepID=UPI001D5A6E96|nr:lysoplasmalogenase [Pararhodobacter sp.]MCB1345797.1 lysoplasmalogenase [Paracoccaceae bacterium]MCC0073952.1 lysoplasmalogenase [Rhodobacter sp.]HPD91338.1 lysoplasmalogenase [Pararhodobacter sp.]
MSLALYVLAVATLAALAYGLLHSGRSRTGLMPSVTKTLATALLALAGWLSGAPDWAIAGLVLGAAGDFALSRPGTPAFLAGMAAFALGHLAYAWGFSGGWAHTGALPVTLWVALAAMLVLGGVTLRWIAPRAGVLAWPVRGYTLVIGAMALTAAGMADGPGVGMIQLGVTLFVASDLVLALGLFVATDAYARRLAAQVLWPLYWGGQLLILLGALCC